MNERQELARRAAQELARAVSDMESAGLIKTVRDADRRSLIRARDELSLMVRALDLALSWVGPNGTLGRVLKTMPPDAAQELEQALREAGL